ncbi:hypothetical protein OG410_10795 [Streptomyces sp. NBC_00659]|uniref:hypothetical protein n=1 Tax=Streptomyces sp. NBC_00659 TaxID=2903669 RepID=UPI002E33584E|nr:hypothetical protein [Streptomyces sp. NBC_00659]
MRRPAVRVPAPTGPTGFTNPRKPLPAHAPATPERLPADTPVRETKTLVLGSLLLDRRTRDAVRPLHHRPYDRAPSGGELWHYARGESETDVAFAARVRAPEPPERRYPAEDPEGLAAETAAKRNVLLALVHGGVAPPEASGSVHRLLPGPVDGCGPAALTAGDLGAALGRARQRRARRARWRGSRAGGPVAGPRGRRFREGGDGTVSHGPYPH